MSALTEVARSSGEERNVTSSSGCGNRVTLWLTSPIDGNEALRYIMLGLFEGRVVHRKPIVKLEPRNLYELEDKIREIRSCGQKIDRIVFLCHSSPIAIKPTNNLIKMPDHPQFNSDQYFLENSRSRRIPSPAEYESFDRFVEIIRDCLAPNGKVFLLGCSTAVDTDHPEKNIARSLALRLPKHTVIGTSRDLVPNVLYISAGSEDIKSFADVLKEIVVEKRPYSKRSQKINRVIVRIFSPYYS